ncbi:disulfide bond formation protein DsbA, partial [Peptoniphilus sp.]|uniref:disulfide bond formation protein DsbA n=1 Tax=Peptoniphilus sp. TaxID=1971214 RepID=UPI003D8CB07A
MLKIFTDVLDPFLWGIYPKIRNYEFFYENFEYDFVMSGLIGNYEEFLPENFRDKNNVSLGNKILYDMYRATATMTKMPGFSEIPNLYTDKYKSTYPLDKYYLAFKEIDRASSKKYMRRLLEYAILYEKNIFLPDVQREILKEFDVDFEEFFMEYEMIDEIFLENRMLSFDYRIKKLP